MREAHAMRRVLFFAAAFACTKTGPPRAQLVLYVDTDAVVPSHVHQVDRPLVLFDRLSIDVTPPDVDAPCEGCRRFFDVSKEQFSGHAVSIGIPSAPHRTGYRARVRLYKAAFLAQGEPPQESTIESNVTLPPVGDEGEVSVTVTLRTDDVGRVLTGVIPAPGPPASSLVGSWPGAKRVDCAGTASSGEACIPGGAFWMGSSIAPPGPYLDDLGHHRLVVVSPFFMDVREVTVVEMRQSMPATEIPVPWSGSTTGSRYDDWCTYTAAPDRWDDYPINCVSWLGARQYCQKRNADLPTEAQFEYVASGLVGDTFVWGADDPPCDAAVFARGGAGLLSTQDAPCNASMDFGGAEKPGSGAWDRLTIGNKEIVDLAGNLNEMTLDSWLPQNDPCWSSPGVQMDPFCTASSSNLHAVRGGGWLALGSLMEAAFRRAIPATKVVGPDGGFRCARPSR
jgi:formylglycine-generating enzyme required for sulfatase activity